MHRDAADLSFGQGEFELALAEYDVGLELQPQDPRILANKASCLLQLQQYEECVEWCNSSLDIVDESKPKMRASLLVRRGSAMAKLGKYEHGKIDLQAAIALHPKLESDLAGDLALIQSHIGK